jgi:predicted ArsR family transcriptional regulator
MNNITITKSELMVGGKAVATVTNFQALRDALLDNLTRREAVYLAVALMGEGRTADIAKLLGMDKANTSKRLESLADEGRIAVVDDCHTDGRRGRPSRLWAVADGHSDEE